MWNHTELLARAANWRKMAKRFDASHKETFYILARQELEAARKLRKVDASCIVGKF